MRVGLFANIIYTHHNQTNQLQFALLSINRNYKISCLFRVAPSLAAFLGNWTVITPKVLLKSVRNGSESSSLSVSLTCRFCIGSATKTRVGFRRICRTRHVTFRCRLGLVILSAYSIRFPRKYANYCFVVRSEAVGLCRAHESGRKKK